MPTLPWRLTSTPITPPLPPKQALVLDERYRNFFRDVLARTFFSGVSPIDDSYMADHLENRVNYFSNYIVPWVRTVAPNLDEFHIVEIGSGTGASTLAFAPVVRTISCFELNKTSTDAAKLRLGHFGFTNVDFNVEYFSREYVSRYVIADVDAVILCAVLEHMTLEELIDALQAAWSVLKPGGLLVVCDTPNRLTTMDAHTSFLPFFSHLPPEVRLRYAVNSPRRDFVEAMASKSHEQLTRWGSGISYHDIELALGSGIHQCVALDGFEPVLQDVVSAPFDDSLIQAAFVHHKVPAHRAFTRSCLNFALRKPPRSP